MSAQIPRPDPPRPARPLLGLAARPGGPSRHRRGVGDARGADRHRRHRRPRAAHRIGARLPDLAALHRRLARGDARDGHPRRHRVRQPHADVRPGHRRGRHLPLRRAPAPRAPGPVLAGARDRPVCAAAGDHRRHHGADEPQPVRRRPALLRVRRARRALRRPGGAGLRRRPGPRVRAVAALVRRHGAPHERPRAGHGRRRHPGHRLGPARRRRRRRAQRADPEFMQHVHSWPAYAPAGRSPSCCSSASWRTPPALRLRCGSACCSASSCSRSSWACGRRAPDCRSCSSTSTWSSRSASSPR